MSYYYTKYSYKYSSHKFHIYLEIRFSICGKYLYKCTSILSTAVAAASAVTTTYVKIYAFLTNLTSLFIAENISIHNCIQCSMLVKYISRFIYKSSDRISKAETLELALLEVSF